MSLTIVGSVAFDAIQTPYGQTDKIIGGAGTYICLASSYMKKKQNVIAVVGEDFPKDYINLLELHGTDTKGLQVKAGEKTFFWSGKYHDNMNSRETLVTELNVLENFDPIVPDAYQDTEYLMLGNLSPIVQRQVIERLENRPKLIVMDTMNFWMDIMLDELKKTISLVDVLTINDEEAEQLSGKKNIVEAAESIMAMGPSYVIIKKGEHGALLFGKDGNVFSAPAMPLKQVFDPTGAGDTFAGGFISYIAKQNDVSFATMKKAIIAGSVLASFCVEKFGTEKLVNLPESEIESRINAFVELSQFDPKL